jgi:hypothetical protein
VLIKQEEINSPRRGPTVLHALNEMHEARCPGMQTILVRLQSVLSRKAVTIGQGPLCQVSALWEDQNLQQRNRLFSGAYECDK